MTDASSLVRSLLIYGVCLPLAVFVGYLLAAPMDVMSLVLLGILFGVLTIPIFLRWHHLWLIAFWNANMMAFFLPGRPTFALVMCAISLTLSVLQHILNKRIKFLSVPTIAWPLVFLTAVVLITAELTGGIGLQIAGGQSFGGKRYLLVVGAVMGYFALTARQAPQHKVNLYVGLYFLGALTSAAANLAGVISPGLYFIFLIFPVDPLSLGASPNVAGGGEGVSRLGGLAGAALALVWVMLAFYGVKGLFRKNWRTMLLLICFVSILFGGYRGNLITFALTFGILFFMEGMMRSRVMPVLLLTSVLGGALLLSFTDRLPFGVQRTLSFLPVHVDPIVAADVKDSTDWRLDMWKIVIPDIPKYLILGKGYSFDPAEMEMIQSGLTKGEGNTSAGSALAGDYHNGPLSVIMPFGIFGVIGFLWLLGAGIKVLRQNYRYGDPALEQINRFLLAQFIAKAIFFFTIFGSLYSDLPFFTGLLGLSVCINGGVRRGLAPAPAPKIVINKFKLAGANAVR